MCADVDQPPTIKQAATSTANPRNFMRRRLIARKVTGRHPLGNQRFGGAGPPRGLASQEGQHGQDPAVLALVEIDTELGEDAPDVGLDQSSRSGGARADSAALSSPAAIRVSTVARGRSGASSGSRSRRRATSRPDEPGSMTTSPARRPGDVGGERRQVGDTVLEQVADAAVEVVHQAQGVVGLDVLRQQQDPDLRAACADRRGRVEPSASRVGGIRRSRTAMSGGSARTSASSASASPACR